MTGSAGTISNGQTVVVSLTASDALNTVSQAVLTVGGVSHSFIVTTEPVDITPDSLSFITVSTGSLNTAITSNTVTIWGLNTVAPISITNGEYSIDGGPFTDVASTINNDQTVAIKVMSAATSEVETQAVVTIGGAVKSFSVITTDVLAGIRDTPLNIAGVVTTIAGAPSAADGIGATARFNNPTGVVNVGAYLYVTDTYNHRIRKIEKATGAVTTLAGSSSGYADGTGTEAQFYRPEGITSDGTYLYVVDTINRSIRKVEIATGIVTTLAGGSSGYVDGIGTSARFGLVSGITTDGTNLYVTDEIRIRKIEIATGTVTTLAGSGSYGSTDGTGTTASFRGLRGITTDGIHLYVADKDNYKVRKIELMTGVVTTLAGSGSSGTADGIGASASFNYPEGITTNGTHLYIADTGNDSVRKIEIATGLVATLAGSGSFGDTDGPGVTASFNGPNGITTDGTYLYVADAGNKKIRKIMINTGAVTSLAGSRWDTDGAGSSTGFYRPSGITSDGDHLYVADTFNNKIRKVEIATGIVSTFAGSHWGETALISPYGITTDGIHLYICDTGNHKIRKIEIATGVITTLAGGSMGNSDGIGAMAKFNTPVFITTDGTNLYVSDSGNYKIRKIVIATGVVTTLAGGLRGNADGIGAAASFAWPTGIATDGPYIYVSDNGNHTIRKIEADTGVVSTLAGSGSAGAADGISTAASFNFPSSVAIDGTYLYIADSSNNKIRKIEIATGTVTTIAGSGSAGSDDGVNAGAKFNNPVGITTDGYVLYVTDRENNTIRKIE